MGVKVLQCFPWYRRGKDRGKGRLCPPPAVASCEVKAEFSPTVTWGCGSEGGETRPVYFSHKAHICLRHQMEGNVIDATY